VRTRDHRRLFADAVDGDRGAAGRLLSMVERGGENAQQVAALAFAPSESIDAVIGVTGAPGAGKSTLTDGLVAEARRAGHRVGVLAIDPSSPYSGGAILGDRVRMQRHADDPGVFIRSMATRGHHGGLALAVPEAIRLLGAIGYRTVVVETVGVGQVEVDIAGAADTTVVVVTPGWGDSVQASKAGLLEIADVFVVNKADRPGVDQTVRDLETMLDLDPLAASVERDPAAPAAWRPPVLATVATTGEGVAQVWEQLCAHHERLARTGELERRRRRRLLDELERALVGQLRREVRLLADGDAYREVADSVLAGRLDPQAGAERLAALAGLAERGPGR
jgi:LAO/AO transport system kinase